MADLPLNKSYNNPISSAIGTSIKLAKTFGRGQMTPNRQVQTSAPTTMAPRSNMSNALGVLKQLGAVTTPYGGSTKYEAFHPGVDIANQIGTPIPALASGKVIATQSGYKQGDKGFGNRVIVEDAAGNRYYYSHLNQEYVKLGQYVPAGSYLGTMGSSGQTYSLHGGDASHLDFRIKNKFNEYVSPYNFLNNI